MIKGRLILKSERQAGKICSLLNWIKDAEYYKEEQDKFNKQFKKLIKNIRRIDKK